MIKAVIMGVSGCGKSFIGSALAQALGLPFLEGDALHPVPNGRKMAAGIPLSDGARATLEARVATRPYHFMSALLLDSQLAAL